MDVESSTLTYSIVDDSLYRDKNTERGSHFCRGIWILREPLGEDGNSGGCFAGLLELGSQKFALGRGCLLAKTSECTCFRLLEYRVVGTYI